MENYSKLFLAAVLRALNNISDSLGEQQKGAAPPAQQSVEQVVRHTGRQRHRTKPGEMGIACIPSFPAESPFVAPGQLAQHENRKVLPCSIPPTRGVSWGAWSLTLPDVY